MAYQNKFIAPFQIGQENDIDAWMIPDNAFVELRNMYLYRGRLRKKFGYTHLGRLTIILTAQALGNTAASPFAVNIFGALGIFGTLIPGSVTINIAAPVGPLTYVEPAIPDGTLDAGGGNTGTIDYTNGNISLIHPAAAASAVTIDLTYAKGLPVMGLPNRELPALNFEELIAFDTDDAYLWNTVANAFALITPAAGGWTGTDSDFFWCANYWVDALGNNLLWVTNNVAADRIRYYIGGGIGGWTTITPQLNVGNTRQLWTCLILVAYRNRLIALNTQERDTVAATTRNYQSRARWCGISDPTVIANWDDTTPGLGNYIDAPTNERIITARFVKDVLVVGFERSTWILKYTFDYTAPFIWERVHSEFGCESTFSSVVFDNSMFQVGFRGINAANSYTAERIDLKVPYLVQQIQNDNEGNKRVHGIRDFYNQMVYWTYADQRYDSLKGQQSLKIYPESIIAYNYLENAFSTYDASFTCFGYYQPANDLTWAQATEISWESADFAWNSGQTQAGFPSIVAGNQVGFVHRLENITNNGISVFITDITQAFPCVITAPNHNMQDGQCIKIVDVLGMTELNDNNYFVTQVFPFAFALQELDVFGNLINVDSTGYTPYVGSGFIKTIDNFSIVTKQFNPFETNDVKVRIGFSEFMFTTTDDGEVSVDVYLDQNDNTPINSLTIPTSNSLLPPLPSDKEWKRIYINSVGNYLQFKIHFTNLQIADDDINSSVIELHSINLAVDQSGRRQSFS